MTGKAKGYFLGAVAAATYGMNPLFALPLYDDGMDSDSVLFFRYLFAIPLLAIMLKARGRSLAIKRCEVAPLLFFGVMIALSSLTLFLSYGYMGASIASTLLFIYPILVALIMAVMFHERLRAATVVCMLSALHRPALQKRGRVDNKPCGLNHRVFLVALLCHLSRWRKPRESHQGRAYTENHALRSRVRALCVHNQAAVDWTDNDAVALVYVGQRAGSCRISHGDILPVHHRRNPEHRLHPNRNSRRAGASHRNILRHHDFRRDNVGTAKRRTGAHNRGCDPGDCRRKPFGAADTLPASLPASAQKKIMLAVSAELRNFTA